MAEHHGRYYDFSPLQMAPAPERPVPVVVGGESKAALRRAARADGWVGADPLSFEGATTRLALLGAARDAAGTAGGPFECILSLSFFPSPDQWDQLSEAGATGVGVVPVFDKGSVEPSLEGRLQFIERVAASRR
jgi:alkanesulfonate monooxygenase SsuD/methylene tetrahydromethanopterin reductase-like flavin-dependent oxidoreductase (luciferase family)